MIDGKKAGTLILYQHKLQNLEQEFLRSSNMAIVISSLMVMMIAVLFSVWIARKMTNPLRKLVAAIHQIASGEKVDKVKINTNDEIHELGEAFNEMSEKLTRNEEIRQALVADVAHELRTPLAILQGKLESIQEDAINPSEQVILELTDEVYRLNRLVSDLQQLSLAEAGKLSLKIERMNVKELITRICSNLQWLADEKEITLRYGAIPDQCWLMLDRDRMTQVLVNLIGNALRHTPEKGIVEVSVQEGKDQVFIQVADNGPGIPKEALPFIFDRFYKRDQSRNRNEGGTGLGLSIAKGFVEAHGGSITVESEVGKGTIFRIMVKGNTRQ
ncbi:sensor histidine kinase [Bacillus sp. T3]|uniref:sensor histidine kinase n=1 Tax=Bacillus sp. T3 TaxID=467262 RepID=UPI002981C5A2|nr:ATP-binding protein [Bacillus sp. T3]